MTNAGILVLIFGAGLVLGAFYFLNLWITVRRITDAPNPALLAISNFVVRMAVVMAGFYFITAHHWERLLAALVGFVVMRQILVRVLGPKASPT